MPDLRTECRERSIDLLTRASHEVGFLASPSLEHYAAVWTRDAAIACLGAAVSGVPSLVATSAASLRTMARLVSEHGQIANAYWPGRDYWDWGEAGTTDASAWFILALGGHIEATGDDALARELWPAARAALTWLSFQDVTATTLIDTTAGGDWMDSSLKRSGRVFHVNVVYWAASVAANRLAARLNEPAVADPAGLAEAIDLLFWPRAGADLSDLLPRTRSDPFPHPLAAGEYARLADPNRRHYLAMVSFGRFVDACDVLAHCLAVAWGLVSGDRAHRVMIYLDEAGVTTPYPSRVWPVPFALDDPRGLVDPVADELQHPRWRNPPHAYHNGAAWPYVGAIHALALVRTGRHADAARVLEGVARANRLGHWGFHEWIHGASGTPSGAPDQTWNAGAYVLADSALGNAHFT